MHGFFLLFAKLSGCCDCFKIGFCSLSLNLRLSQIGQDFQKPAVPKRQQNPGDFSLNKLSLFVSPVSRPNFTHYFKELFFKAPLSQLQLFCLWRLNFSCFMTCFFISIFWIVWKYCVCFWLCFSFSFSCHFFINRIFSFSCFGLLKVNLSFSSKCAVTVGVSLVRDFEKFSCQVCSEPNL